MRGECLCGRIAFEISGPLPKIYQCHCSLCRKQSGTASNAGLLVAKEHFRWLKGEGGIASYVKDTGFRGDFCPHCGSVVPNPFRDRPYFWVPAGALDDSEPLEIAVHICTSSKASWDAIAPGTPQFDGLPALSALIDLTAPSA